MRFLRPVTVAAVAALALAGCADSNPEAIDLSGITEERAEDPVIPTGPGGMVSLTAGDLYFEDLDGVAVDGEVVFTVENVGGFHNLVIDQAAGGKSKIEFPAGETTTDSLLLYGAPGGTTYTYYCDIPGHRAAGMEGQLSVFLTEEEALEEGGADAEQEGGEGMTDQGEGDQTDEADEPVSEPSEVEGETSGDVEEEREAGDPSDAESVADAEG